MNVRIITLLFFFMMSYPCYSQAKEYISFHELKPKVGTVIKIEALDYQDDLDKYYFDKTRMDSLIVFLEKNPNVKIEVTCNADFNDSPLLSMMITTDQAAEIRNYLVNNGIKGTRIEIYGNGDMNPVVSEEDLASLSVLEVKEANKKNRRIEIKIVSNDEPAPNKKKSKGVRSYIGSY